MEIPPQTLAGLSLAEKRMLLAELLQKRASESAAVFPLSHGQRGLWFLCQMDPLSPAYNVCSSSRIRSPLDLDAFRRAVRTLVERHPCLRTTFEERDGALLQRVHPELPLPLEVIDACGWSEEALRTRLEAEAHHPYDLERGPLVRLRLFLRARDDAVFLMGVHHIIGDFWSLVLVMEEMQSLYPAECTGTPVSLPPPSRHYRDFVRWQADLLAGAEGQRLWSYWQKQLAGVPHVLDLPTDWQRPPLFSHRGGATPCSIAPGLALRLKKLAASAGVTLYTMLLAAFQVLISRYTGQDDFLIGSPFAGRNRPGFETVIGYFVNFVPLRADLSGDPSFRTLLGKVGATVLDALAHQDYPFDLLVERLKIERDLSRTPLVQVSFTLEKAHRAQQLGAWRFFLPPSGARLTVGGLELEQYYVELRSSQFDLEMIFEEGDGTLEGMLRYNRDLLERETARRIVGHFHTLLEGVAEDADRRLSDLPCLTQSERRLVLHQWSRTDAFPPPELCLHQWFERQAARTPEALALSDDDRALTYAALEAWSNRLAHHLRRRGIGPGVLVALCLERSPEMIAAILGTLKAGAAYVPLDPGTPAERIRLVLADTGSPVLLTHRAVLHRLPECGAAVICVDDPFPGSESDDGSHPPESGVQSSDIAYVIYTSGSTGRPKGVMVEHRAIGNTIAWRDRELTLYAEDRVLYNMPYTFDPSLCIIFPTLAVGGRMILAAPGEEYDPHRLLQRVLREQVTILEAPPAVLRLMLDDPLFAACRTLRWVCCGGEAMPRDLPRRLLNLLDVTLYNLYGPTEAAVDSTWWACRADDTRPAVPIGRPIANMRAYVLDARLRPVPPGVPGELYVGGASLARGYLNDPVATAERFLPDPFAADPDPAARLYRTGDRCRWMTDGALEFLGRRDDQVKVRGFRVELGEVEATLMRHPEVREAAVAAVAGDGELRLVAYVVGHDDASPPSIPALRRHMRDHLPDYMVPAVFLTLPALPRTASAKVDRRALPAPPGTRPATGRPFVAPRTPLEEFLAGLWREVLRLEEVGAHDHFFELGGSSIQGAILINRLQHKLGEQVYVTSLFDSPTVRGLAHYLVQAYPDTIRRLFGPEALGEPDSAGEDTQPADSDGEVAAAPAAPARHRPGPRELLVALQPEGALTPCFLVHPPGGIVVCYQPLAYRLGRDRPFYGIRSRGLHGEVDLPGRMEEMAAEYVEAIRQVQPRGPYHLGGWSAGGLVALEMAQQLQSQGDRVSLLALLDTTAPAAPGSPAGEDASGREYGLDLSLAELARMGPDEQLPYLWEHAQKLGLIEPEVPLDVAHQVLHELKRLFHHHMVLADEYIAQPYRGPITLFRPTDAPLALAAPTSTPTAADRGWGRLAAAVDVHFVPGQHHSMVKEPHVQILAQKLRACLRRAEEN